MQHTALDAANEGFIAALDEAGIPYEADQQNASGEQANCMTIAEKLVNDGSDLILAIATPAAQAVAGVTEEIPVLLTAVTDPAESGWNPKYTWVFKTDASGRVILDEPHRISGDALLTEPRRGRRLCAGNSSPFTETKAPGGMTCWMMKCMLPTRYRTPVQL